MLFMFVIVHRYTSMSTHCRTLTWAHPCTLDQASEHTFQILQLPVPLVLARHLALGTNLAHVTETIKVLSVIIFHNENTPYVLVYRTGRRNTNYS